MLPRKVYYYTKLVITKIIFENIFESCYEVPMSSYLSVTPFKRSRYMNTLLPLVVALISFGNLFSGDPTHQPELLCIAQGDSSLAIIALSFTPDTWDEINEALKKADARMSFIHLNSLRTNRPDIQQIQSVYAGIPAEHMKKLSQFLSNLTNKRQ